MAELTDVQRVELQLLTDEPKPGPDITQVMAGLLRYVAAEGITPEMFGVDGYYVPARGIVPAYIGPSERDDLALAYGAAVMYAERHTVKPGSIKAECLAYAGLLDDEDGGIEF